MGSTADNSSQFLYSLSNNSFVREILFLIDCFEASFFDSAQQYSRDGRSNGTLSTTEIYSRKNKNLSV